MKHLVVNSGLEVQFNFWSFHKKLKPESTFLAPLIYQKILNLMLKSILLILLLNCGVNHRQIEKCINDISDSATDYTSAIFSDQKSLLRVKK